MSLEQELQEEMLEMYGRTGRETGYWANYFNRDVKTKGGLQVAKELLSRRSDGSVGNGLQTLIDHGRADLSLESLVLNPRFAELFTAAELDEARSRLDAIPPHGFRTTDIAEILSRKLPVTQKKALVDARIGQGKFRVEVLGLWSHRCAATGVTVKAAIRASHIKPWRVSSDADRLNPHNGLPLVATLDSLFDSGLIAFESAGDIMLSSVLKARDVEAMDLKTLRLRRTPPAATQDFLDYHRQHVFVG